MPFGAADNARKQVVRKDAFRAFAPSIDGESDSLVEKREVSLLFAAVELLSWKI